MTLLPKAIFNFTSVGVRFALLWATMFSDVLILLAAEFIPMGVLVGLASLVSRWQTRQGLRLPVSEKLLRAPGESLRRRLEALDEQIALEVMAAFFLPFLVVSVILAQQRSSLRVGVAVLFLLAVAGVVA